MSTNFLLTIENASIVSLINVAISNLHGNAPGAHNIVEANAMPTKRRRIEHPVQARITPELVELFRRAEEISAAGLDEKWEDEGGARREYLDIKQELHVGLGLKPWQESPLDVASDAGPPVWDLGSWEMARGLRQALQAALEAQG